MEKLTFKDFKAGKGFWADREEDVITLEAQGLKDNDIIINFAYTDYGGDFVDNVCIEYFIEEARQDKTLNFNWHKTAYYGKNGILWGDIAVKFWEACQNYLLGYDGIEDFYYTKLYEAQLSQAQDFLNDYEKTLEKPFDDNFAKAVIPILTDVLNNYNILPSGQIDICENTLIEALNDFLEGDYKMILSEEREKKADLQYIGKIE